MRFGDAASKIGACWFAIGTIDQHVAGWSGQTFGAPS